VNLSSHKLVSSNFEPAIFEPKAGNAGIAEKANFVLLEASRLSECNLYHAQEDESARVPLTAKRNFHPLDFISVCAAGALTPQAVARRDCQGRLRADRATYNGLGRLSIRASVSTPINY